jgi:uncharacterized protein (DUF1501 family)
MKTTRRSFLKSALGGAALASFAPAVPSFLTRAALAATSGASTDRVLVLLQLTGGNDGLNTLVPFADDLYARSRTTLRLTGRNVLRISDEQGFHPKMSGFKDLYDRGLLSVAQGVGFEGSSRDHEAAMHAWQTARPDDPYGRSGWVGRAADAADPMDAATTVGAFVAPIAAPRGLNAGAAVLPTVHSLDDYVVPPAGARLLARLAGVERGAAGGAMLDYVQRGAAQGYAAAERIAAARAVSDGLGASPYPAFGLARDLRTVAQLIRAEAGVRIYFTELGGGGFGGFDNHAGQRDNHAALLQELSASLKAFADDLAADGLLERVLLMTFSEFGRTVSENGRRGTGHGAAAPIFLVGGHLKGGLIGRRPSLTDLDQDAPKPHTDFRRVYTTALDRWLGIPAEPILGSRFAPVDALRV